MTVNQVRELAGHFIIQRGSTSPQPAAYGRLWMAPSKQVYIFIYNICSHPHMHPGIWTLTLWNAESAVWAEYRICMDTAATLYHWIQNWESCNARDEHEEVVQGCFKSTAMHSPITTNLSCSSKMYILLFPVHVII